MTITVLSAVFTANHRCRVRCTTRLESVHIADTSRLSSNRSRACYVERNEVQPRWHQMSRYYLEKKVTQEKLLPDLANRLFLLHKSAIKPDGQRARIESSRCRRLPIGVVQSDGSAIAGRNGIYWEFSLKSD